MIDKSCKCDHLKPCCLELAIAQERLSKLEAVRKAAAKAVKWMDPVLDGFSIPGNAEVRRVVLNPLKEALKESE